MSILIMIFLLSILILVHELGHFAAARFFNIKVEKFGFGLPIGPTLFEKKCGDTTILVHAFLLGGYVAFPDDDKDCKLDEKSPERFVNKPIYQRAIVVSAGVVANVVCAFAFVFLTAALWGHLPSGKYNIYVDEIIAPKNESIWQSGLKDKDKIVTINGSKIETTYSLLKFIQLSKKNDGKADKSFIYDNYTKLKSLNPVWMKDEILPKGVFIRLPEAQKEPPIVLSPEVMKGFKKYQDSEAVLSDNQKKIRKIIDGKGYYEANGATTLYDVACALSDSSRPINIQVQRGNKIIDLRPVEPNEKGQIGIKLEAKEILIPTTTFRSVLKAGTKYLADNTYMLIYGLGQIFTGQIPLKELHGIVAITKVGGDIITNSGIFSGLLLTAIISMDLAIVNFLPIPALDGGHLLFLFFERLRGRPVDEKILEKISNIGFYFLIVLMVVVIFNDIFGLVTKKF